MVVWIQLPLRWNTYLLFSSDIVHSVWEIDDGGGRKYSFVNFCSLVVLSLSVGEGWWGGSESLI